jgi:DNA cross-link repair 1A protein
VDAFCFGKIPGITDYFLTHFHADHYMGLTPKFTHGPIYCSEVTANLIMQELRIKPEWVKKLPMHQRCQINDHVAVTLYDANQYALRQCTS